MPHTRSLKFLLSVCIAASASCATDAPTSLQFDALTSRVQQLGFSTVGMQVYDDYVVVEGDIRLEKANLLNRPDEAPVSNPSSERRPPRTPSFQYSTNLIVSQAYVDEITVDLTDIESVSNWASAVRTAIAAYNNSASGIHMSEASPGDITFGTISQASYIGRASWPQDASTGGKPGETITANTYYNYLALNQKQWVMAHELGHTLGLRHDNADSTEGPGTIGANLVPGTVVVDNNSVMNPSLGSRTWVGFSYYDLVALRTLYPPPSPLTVALYGFVDVNSSPSCRLKYEAVPSGGSPPYTYSWQTDGAIVEESYDHTTTWASFSPSGSYFVEVTVTDDVGSQEVIQDDIQSSPWEFECMQ